MGWCNKIDCTTEKISIHKVSSKINKVTEYKRRRAIAKREIKTKKDITSPGNNLHHSTWHI